MRRRLLIAVGSILIIGCDSGHEPASGGEAPAGQATEAVPEATESQPGATEAVASPVAPAESAPPTASAPPATAPAAPAAAPTMPPAALATPPAAPAAPPAALATPPAAPAAPPAALATPPAAPAAPAAAPAAVPAAPTGQVELLEVHGSGYVSDGVIRRLYDQASGGVQACYEEILAREPEVAGEVSFAAWFRSDGSLYRTTVPPLENTLNHEELEACVSARMAGWPFPPPPEGSEQLGRAKVRLRFSPAP